MKKKDDQFRDETYEAFSEENEQNTDGSEDRDFASSERQNAAGEKSKKRSSQSGSADRSRGSGKKETVHLTPEERRRNAERFEKVVQYLFLGIGVFIFICLLLNLICNFGNRLAGDPSKHWMGYIGYWISYAFHGLFGAAAFILPVGMIVFFIFWRRLREERRLAFKLLNSVALLLLTSTLIHTFYLAIAVGEKTDIGGGELFRMGASLRAGGFLGGKIAYAAVRFLNWAGAFVLEFILFFASFFYMLGMTPRYILTRWNHRRELSEKSKKTLSEQEAEKAKRRAKEAAEEKRAQSSTVKTTPEGFPDGSVTVYKKSSSVGPVREADTCSAG